MNADLLQLIILPAGIIAVLFAIYLARDVLARDTGTKAMEDVAGTIFEGAVAFVSARTAAPLSSRATATCVLPASVARNAVTPLDDHAGEPLPAGPWVTLPSTPMR